MLRVDPLASELLAVYLDASASTTDDSIRAALLREWDHRVAIFGLPLPSLDFPILPPAVTGLDANVRRPQYGTPVLPQNRDQAYPVKARHERGLRILSVGDEWQSGHGGLSTFNRQLCSAMAAAGADVVCLVLKASPDDRKNAEACGVTLVEATPTPGLREQDALVRRPQLPDGFTPDLVIGHGRVTGPQRRFSSRTTFLRQTGSTSFIWPRTRSSGSSSTATTMLGLAPRSGQRSRSIWVAPPPASSLWGLACTTAILRSSIVTKFRPRCASIPGSMLRTSIRVVRPYTADTESLDAGVRASF